MKKQILHIFLYTCFFLTILGSSSSYAQPFISIDDILLCQKTNNGTINYQLTGLDPSKSYEYKWTLFDITGSLVINGQDDRDNCKIQGDKNINNGINFGMLRVEVWEVGCSEDTNNNGGVPTSCYNFKEVSVGYYTAPPITLDQVLPIDQCVPPGGSVTQSLISTFDASNLPNGVNIAPEWQIQASTGTTTQAHNDLVTAAQNATNAGDIQFDVTIDNNDFDIGENVITVTVVGISSCGDTANDESDTFTLTFYRTPEPSVSGLVEVCAANGQNLGEIIPSVADPFTYSWTINSTTGGTVTFNGSGSNQSGLTITDVQFDPASLFIDIVFDVSVSGGAGSCPGATFQVNVRLVNSNLAAITSPICVLDGTTGQVINIPNSVDNLGVDYAWSVSNVTNGSFNLVSYGNDNAGLRLDNINFTGNNAVITADINLIANGVNTSCNTQTFPITIFRQPNQLTLTDITTCAIDGASNILGVAEDANPLTGYTYNWAIVSSANGTFTVTPSANGTGFNLDNVTFNANQQQITGVVRLTIGGMDASCGPSTIDLNVTIDKIPTAASTPPPFICVDNGSSNHLVISPNASADIIPGFVYNWSYTLDVPADGSLAINALGTDNSGLEFNNVTFNGNATQLTGNITLSVTGSVCAATSTNIPFTIFRRPDVLNVTSVDLCIADGTTTFTAVNAHTENFSGFSYDWTLNALSGGTLGITPNGNNNSGLEFTNINFDANSQVITATLDLVINGLDATCGNTMSIPVTIHRQPDVLNNLTDFETCALNGAIIMEDIVTPYTEDFPTINYSWNITTITGGTISVLANGNDNSGLQLTGANFSGGSSIIQGTIEVTVTGAGSNCTVTPQTFNFTIHRLPDGLQINDTEICEIDGTSNVIIQTVNADIVAGYNYTWSLFNFTGGTADVNGFGTDNSGVQIDNISFSSGSTEITATLRGTVTGVDASCAASTKDITLTINRIPDAIGLTLANFCLIDGAVSEIIALEQGETLAGYTYTWNVSTPSGGTITTSTYGTQNSGLQLDNVTFNPNSAFISATATITVTGADPSCGVLQNTIPITIHRIPDVASLTDVTVCAFNPDANIQMIAPNATSDIISGTNYTWTITSVAGGTVTESPLGTDNSGLEFTSINFSNNSTSITGNINLSITGLNISCGTITTSIPFTIYRKPDQLNLTSIDLCMVDGTASTNAVVANTEFFAGYNFDWTLTNLNGGTFGITPNGNNNSGVDFTNINFDNNSEQITATLDLVINGLDASCGNTVTIPVTIDRIPDLLANLPNFETCVLEGTTTIDVITASTELLPTITYNWSKTGGETGGTTGALVSYGNNNSGLRFTNVNFDNGSNIITGQVQLSVTGLSGSCGSSTATFTYTIHRLPDALEIADTEICAFNTQSGIQIQAVGTEIVTAYNYTWSISNFTGGTAAVAGIGADGSGVVINNVDFSTNSNQITATIRGTVNGMNASCTGATKDITLTINRIPDALQLGAQTFCLSEGAVTEIIAAEQGETLTGYSYNWVISGVSGGTVSTSTYGAQNSGLQLDNITFNAGSAQITGTATLTVNGAAASCGTLSNSIPFTIHRLPDPLALTSVDQCLLHNASNVNIFSPNATAITGFNYTWSFLSISGGSITLQPYGNNNSGLEFDNVQFTGASNQIQAVLQLSVSGIDAACTTTPITLPVTINRIPDITRFATAIEFCAFNADTDVSIYTEEAIAINGFNYSWSTSSVVGGSFTLDASGNNNSALEFDNITFDPGATQITGNLDLVISGPDASCGSFNQSIPFTIHYQPDELKLTGYSISLCSRNGNTVVNVESENSPSLAPSYNFTWTLTSPITGGNFTISTTGTDNSGLVFNNVTFDTGSDIINTTIELEVVGLSATCGTNTLSIPVVIDLAADPAIINLNTLCEEDGATGIIAQNDDTNTWMGVTSTWTVNIGAGGTFTYEQFGYQNTGLRFNDIQFNNGSDQITGTVTLTQTTACSTVSETEPFTINRRINIDSYTDITLCSFNNETSALTGFAPVTENISNVTYAWVKNATPTGGDFDIVVSADGSGVDITNIVFDANSSIINGELEFTVTSNCNTETKTVPVVINRKVDLNALTFNTLCVINGSTGEIIINESTENIAGFDYNWGTLTNVVGGTFDITPFGNNNSGLTADNIAFNNGSLQITADVTFSVNGSCDANAVTKQITINRIPDVSSLSDIVTCSLDNTDGEGLVTASTENLTGLTYNWSIRTGTLSGGTVTLVPNGNQNSGLYLDDIVFDKSTNPTSNQITFTVDLTITGGCQDVTTSFDVTIDRSVDMTLFPNQIEICELNGASNVDILTPLAETVNGLDYVWTVISPTGGTFTLNPQGTDNSGMWLDNITFNFGEAYINATLRVENTNGCSIQSKDIPLQIGRMPSVANITDFDLCVNQGAVNVIGLPELGEVVGTYDYQWSIDSQTGGLVTISGYGSNDSGLMFNTINFANNSTVISGTLLLTVDNACGNYPLRVNFTLNREPDVSGLSLTNLCAVGNNDGGNLFAEITENLAGWTFNWSLDNGSLNGGSFTLASSGNMNSQLDAQNIVFDANSPQITANVVLTVSSNTCGDHTITLPVVIDRRVDINAVTLNALCVVDGATNQILFDETIENIPGFTYSWGAITNLNGGTFTTVSSGNNSSQLVANNIDFDDNSLQITAEIPLQVTGDCDNTSVNVPVIIQRIPDLSSFTNSSLCVLNNTANVNVIPASTETLTGVTYNWSIATGSLNGGSVTLSPVNPNQSGLDFTNVQFDPSSDVINLTVEVTATGGCQDVTTSFDVAIDRRVDMSLFPNQLDLCELEGATNVVAISPLVETVNNLSFTWEIVSGTISGGTFNLQADGSDNSGLTINDINFDLNSPQITADLRVTNVSGCSIESKTIPIVIGRMPEATTIPSLDLCLADGTTNYIAIAGNTEAVTNYAYTWSVINLNGGTLATRQQGNNQSELLFDNITFDNGSTQITGTIQLDVANACGNYPLNLPLTINRTIDPSTVNLNTICAIDVDPATYELYAGETQNLPGFAYTWTLRNSSVTGGTLNVQAKGIQGSGLEVNAIDFDFNSSQITATATLEINGPCETVIRDYSFTVNRKIDLTSTTFNTLCVIDGGQGILYDGILETIPGFNYDWAAAPINLNGGTFDINPSGNINSTLSASNIQFDNNSLQITGEIALQVSGDCDAGSINIPVTINRIPDITGISDQVLCLLDGTTNENVITASTETLTGVAYSWNIITPPNAADGTVTISGTGANNSGLQIDNLDFANGANSMSFDVQLTTTGGCATQDTTFNITVNRRIDMSLFPDQIDECQLQNATNVVVFAGLMEPINGINYTWEIVSGSLSGGTFNLGTQGPDQSGLIFNDITFDLLSPQITAQVRVTNNTGCNIESKTINVILGRMPEATTIPQLDLCLANGSTNVIAIPGNPDAVTGYVYTWDVINISGGSLTVTQGGNNNSEMIFNNVTFDPNSSQITGTITLDVAGACGNYPLNLPLTITRTVDATSITMNTICAFDQDPMTHEIYAGQTDLVSGWTYVWQIDPTSYVGGTFDIQTKGNGQSGLDASNIQFTNGSDQITANVQLTINGACSAITQTYPVVVNRKMSLDQYTDFTTCADGVDTIDVFTENALYATNIQHTWTSSVTGGTFNLVANGPDQSGLQLADITFTAGSSTIQGTLTVQQNGSCNDIAKTINIELTRSAEFDSDNDMTICSEQTANLVGVVSDESLFNLSWNVISVSGGNATADTYFNGFNGNTSNNLNGLTIDNTYFASGSGVVTVVFELTATNISHPTCISTQQYTINFTRIPEITIPDATAEGCSAIPVVIYPFGTEDFTGDYIFEWTLVPGSITGASAGGETRITNLVNTSGDQNLSVLLEDTDYLNVGTQQITFEVDVKVSNIIKQDCTGGASVKRYTFTIHRSPLVGLPTVRQESCEDGSITVNSSFPQQTNISYNWEIVNQVGGTLQGSNLNGYFFTVSNPTFDANAVEMTADVVLTTYNTAMPGVCPGIDTVQVYFQKDPVPVIDLTEDVGCARNTITVDASASQIPAGGVTYEWDFGYSGTFQVDTTSTTPIMEYMYQGEGNYEVALRITTYLGCQSSVETRRLTIQPSPVARLDIPSLICVGESIVADGTRSTGGTPNGIIDWEWFFDYDNDQVNPGDRGNPTVDHQFLREGIYNVALIITNDLGCQDVVQQQVEVIREAQITYNPTAYICEGQTATLTINGGVRWEWDNGDTNNSIQVSPGESRFYYVNTFNQRDCARRDSIEVVVLPNGLGSSQRVACETDVITLNTIDADPSLIAGIEWDNGQSTTSIDVDEQGQYTYKMWLRSDPSSEPCLYEHTIDVTLNALPTSLLPADTTFCFEDGATIDITATNNQNYAVVWEDIEIGNPTATIEEGGRYRVRMTDLTFETSCTEEFEIEVYDLCPPKFTPPTAFTPNGDGLNDTFFIEGKDMINIQLTIYNRWGEIIFHKEYTDEHDLRDPTQGWDGMYRGKKVTIGDYIYIITYENKLYPGKIFREERGISVIY
ncbi:T9SS type B sorting domain-containing protein [Flammeovirga sp. MY04]|uniref:PKD domain-containing protein n=1 Tax=Flammeovirga sp. MY04 TaxID=1191459 RepID=UPI000806318F|nr:PKD domain-containing protein [Flammeovirga sp. MY04]ANQ51996.1 T9SS type B sorting domain-containing protein [Flammeovirga sp. MY04]